MPTRSHQSFAKWMYKEYGVVAVKPLTEVSTSLHLLDILVREKGDHGQHPVLENIGSMLKLGTSEVRCTETTEELREDLELFENDKRCKFFSRKGEVQEVSQTFSSATCLTGSLLSGVVDAELNLFTKGKGGSVTLESFETVIAEKSHLEKIIQSGDWKPDTEDYRLTKGPQRCLWFPGTQSRGRKMWLVHQLLYVSKIDVSSMNYTSLGGQLAASAISQLILGPTPGAGLKVYRAGDESIHVEAEPGKKILIGFRAISFRFDADGSLCHFESNAGGSAPRVRHAGTDVSDRDHLRGLFLEKPPKEEEEDEEDDEEDDDDEGEGEDDNVEEEEEEEEEEEGEGEWDVQVLDIQTAKNEVV